MTIVRTGRAGALLLALGMLLGGASTAQAQAYRWQDEDGQIHFTDDPSSIPAQFRKHVKQLELPEPTYDPQASARQAASSSSGGVMAQAIEDVVRQRWPQVPASQRQEVAAAILDRLLLLLLALALHTLATLAMFGHAVANRRLLWAAGNLLVIFVPPVYAFFKLDADGFKKALIVVAWAAGPAAGIALQRAIARIVA